MPINQLSTLRERSYFVSRFWDSSFIQGGTQHVPSFFKHKEVALSRIYQYWYRCYSTWIGQGTCVSGQKNHSTGYCRSGTETEKPSKQRQIIHSFIHSYKRQTLKNKPFQLINYGNDGQHQHRCFGIAHILTVVVTKYLQLCLYFGPIQPCAQWQQAQYCDMAYNERYCSVN